MDLRPPDLPDDVRILQEKISTQSEMVQSGEKPQPAILGFIPREPVKLTELERFAFLETLLADCRSLHSHLGSHRVALVSFFSGLATHLRDLLNAKVHQIEELENKRKKLADVARSAQDERLAMGAEDLQERLVRFLRVVCMGAIVLLRSIERCRKELELLEGEERRRQEMMERLAVRIKAHAQMRELEAELSDFEKDAGIESATGFDFYRRETWIPFEDLVLEVHSIDEKLRRAADAIVEFAEILEKKRPGDAPIDSMDEFVVDQLLHAEGDPAMLWSIVQDETAMDRASAGVDVALALGEEPSFERALKNIKTLVNTRLEDCFGEELNRARSLNTPEAWREYLSHYSEGTGAEEARQNLRKLEEEDLTKARGSSDIGDAVPLWRRFLLQFPSSQYAAEAQESIFRFRAETLSRARITTDPHEARGAWHTFATLFPDRTPEESREFEEGMHGALVRIEPTPKRWRDYLQACPVGPLAREAQGFLATYAWVPNWAVAWGMDSPNGRCWAELEVNGVRQRFRLIEPGVFLMGSPAEENANQNEKPQHEVLLTKPFWIADTECTQAFWKAVTGVNPSKFSGEHRPVECVSWEDCVLFAKKLSELVEGLQARLPTEAEWEYACRAGTVGPFAGSGLWQEMAWVMENSGGQTHNAKELSANAWGLYDMHGNVAEWVSDGLRSYDHKKTVDPTGPAPTTMASFRGGSWLWGWGGAHSACRSPLGRTGGDAWLGLRIAASASRDESGWVYYATAGPDLERLAKPSEHGVFLGDLKPLPSSYTAFVNDAWGVRHCMIRDRTCDSFVAVHSPGEFTWTIPEGALQFTTVLARSDIVPSFHSSWAYKFLIDDKAVYSSPPLSEHRNGIPVVIDIPSGARCLTVIIDPLGDRSYDHAILAWPYFRLSPLLERLSHIPEGAIFVGDLVPKKVQVGSGTPNSCKDVNEKVLPIAGKPCTTFLDLAAPASVTYEIPDDAHRFTAIGSRWDQETCAHGTWKYEIYLDGVRVFDSPALHKSPEGIPIDVSISQQARELTIVVDDFGDNSFDSSILAYPCFHLAESANSIARRIGLNPGEVAFQTMDRGWLCTLGEDLVVVDNPLEPGVRFQWQWRDSSECLFNLRAANGQYVRVQTDGRVRLMGPPDPQKEYLALIHASAGRFAIRSFHGYFSSQDRRISAKHTSVGSDESFEIIDVNYPSPPRPGRMDRAALLQEAVVHRAPEEHVLKGIDSCLKVKLKRPLNGSAFSILFWIYYESYDRTRDRSFWFNQSVEARERISILTSWGRLAWRVNGIEVALSRGEFQFRKWHHVAIVIDGIRNILYVDGFPQQNGSCQIEVSVSDRLWFGRCVTAGPESLCYGKIKDILILNRALSPKEIRGIATTDEHG